MPRIERRYHVYALSPADPPALRVADGSTVVFETSDCFADQILPTTTRVDTLDWDRINPATGPVYVEGAEPGDVLAVRIETIAIRDYGVMLTGPGYGVLGDELPELEVTIVPIDDGRAMFRSLSLPVRPMIGVIGTAPAGQPVPCGTPGPHGGNMDTKVIGEGATVYLPVNVPGALLALGDLHALMGDGEVSVTGVEVAGEVTVSVKVLKTAPGPLPLVKTATALYAVASDLTLDQAAAAAARNMVALLTAGGLTKADAVNLLSIAGNLQISQIVDPLKTARMEVPLAVLAALGITV